MEYKKKINIMFYSSFLGVLILFCTYTSDLDNKISQYRFLYSVLSAYVQISFVLIFPSFLLLFCKEGVYRAWKKFAIGVLIFHIFLFFLAFLSVIGGSGGFSGGGFGGGSVGLGMSGSAVLLFLFNLISLIIIAKKSYQLRGVSDKPETKEISKQKTKN